MILGCVLLLSYKTIGIHPPVETFSAKQCLIANIFFESRGESKKGMQAVAAVTMNRVNHKNYPDSVCAVVFQKKQFSWTHEQTSSRILAVLKGDTSWMQLKDRQSYKIAVDIVSSPRLHYMQLLPKNAVFYHSVKVKPYWVKHKIQVARIGRHVFYRS